MEFLSRERHSSAFAASRTLNAAFFLPFGNKAPGSAGVSSATASRKSAFLAKQSHVNNKSVVSDKLSRRDGGAPGKPDFIHNIGF
jgi:hypothetical protein